MKKKSKKYILKVNKDGSMSDPSDFVVDLRKKKSQETFVQPKPGIRDQLFDTYEGIEIKSKLTNNYFIKKENLKTKLHNKYINIKLVHGPNIKNLAIINLILFIINSIKFFSLAIYKLSYHIGWFFLFFIRLIWFSIKFCITKKLDEKKPILASRNQMPYMSPNFSVNILKPSIIFSIVLLMLIIPIKAFTYYSQLDLNIKKNNIINSSEQALDNFLKAAGSITQMHFNEADFNFNEADFNFSQAKKELDNINEILFPLASIAPSKNAQLAGQSRDILLAGKIASEIGSNLSLAINSLSRVNDIGVKIALQDFDKYGTNALNEAKILNIKLNKINYKNLPIQYHKKFLNLKEKTSFLETILNRLVELSQILYELLGSTRDKRYLFIFQNNSEMRATGGFIGSFALIDFKNGKIKNLEVPTGGGYDTESGLRELVASPKPLHLVNPLWHFWDANWWPDWPTSAQELMWFYEKSDGPTVDGVISFTPTVFEEILEILGNIEMKKYGILLTKENFWETVQTIVEKKPDIPGTNNEPKKIIGDLMETIINEMPEKINNEILIKLLQIIENNLDEKHILAYFANVEMEEKIKSMGWAGNIKQTPRDYISVINTNIAGGKSDKVIKETIEHNAKINEDGSIVDTVKIIRSHTGIKNAPFVGVRNVNWIRVYVPEGSELINASGFRTPDKIYFEEPDDSWLKKEKLYNEDNAKIHADSNTKIYNEFGKTVFANWSMLDPGETITIYFEYKLPFKIKFSKPEETFNNQLKQYLDMLPKDLVPYSLLAQKQPGSIDHTIKSSLELSNNFKAIFRYPENIEASNNRWEIEDKLNVDKYWLILITDNEKQNQNNSNLLINDIQSIMNNINLLYGEFKILLNNKLKKINI